MDEEIGGEREREREEGEKESKRERERESKFELSDSSLQIVIEFRSTIHTSLSFFDRIGGIFFQGDCRWPSGSLLSVFTSL